MYYILLCLLGFISFAVNLFGFSQIIGSLRTIQIRGFKLSFITIIIWVIILVLFFFLINNFFVKYIIGYYIGLVLGLIMSLGSGSNGEIE